MIVVKKCKRCNTFQSHHSECDNICMVCEMGVHYPYTRERYAIIAMANAAKKLDEISKVLGR